MYHDLVEEVIAQVSGFVIQQPEIIEDEIYPEEFEITPEEEQ